MSSEALLQRLEALLVDISDRVGRLEERLKPEPTCLTIKAAAKRYGVGETKFREMIKRGEIRVTREEGRDPMVALSEIIRASTPRAEQLKIEAAQRKAAYTPIKRKRG